MGDISRNFGVEPEVEHDLQCVLKALKSLVTPHETLSASEKLDGIFHASIQNAVRALGFDEIRHVPRLLQTVRAGSSETWDFVEVALYILRSLKRNLCDTELSVSQQKDVRSCLQFIVMFGLCPNLLPGVGIPLSSRTAFLSKVTVEKVSLLSKYERLCTVIRAVLHCCECKILRSLIITNIFEDVLAGLLQLSFAPLKKPQDASTKGGESDFVMTFELWQSIQKDQVFYSQKLLKLIMEMHQPTVVSKLMILQAGQGQSKPPLWMIKKCSSLLTQCLLKPGGVASLIRATFDSFPDVGADWEKVETVAKLVTSPSNHSQNIARQLLKLLRDSGKSGSGVFVVVIACVKQLMLRDAPLCQKLIVDPILQPFLTCCSQETSFCTSNIILSEEALMSSFNCIYNCFLSCGSEVSSYSLPINLLVPCISFFFELYCKVNGSASIMYSQVEKLLFQIFRFCDPLLLTSVLRVLLFREHIDGIPAFSFELCFNFGSSGGVQVEKTAENQNDIIHSSVEEAGDNIIILLEHQDSNHEVSLKIFVALMNLLIDIGLNTSVHGSQGSRLNTIDDTLNLLINSSKRQLGIVRILAVLVEKNKVQEKLAKDPSPVLAFLLSLLNSSAQLVAGCSASCEDDESSLHCVFVSLMILNVMLEKCHENTNWSAFKQLLSPLAAIRDKARDSELSRLASGVYNTIATHGALLRNDTHSYDSKKSKCENALHDSCDPLVPIRGHAIVELTKLLWQQDHETISKKDVIFCIFQENLKHEDSFLYLAAVNGMVALAAIDPDQAVKSLINEFLECTRAGDGSGKNPDLRMKVGEVLVKLTRVLGEIAPKYKSELLNAFLVGVKDADHLMRASSLSNLGEVCRILGFRVGPILQEILICIEAVAKFDQAVEPRRASVMVVTYLIQGLGEETIHILQDVLRDLYRSLKHVYFNDTDDVVRLHAQLALQELGTATEMFLFPKLKLEKKVQLL